MPLLSRPSRKTVLAATTGAAAVTAGAWWSNDRAPYPYSQRRLLDLELPFLGLSDLDVVLRPRTGELMLELGWRVVSELRQRLITEVVAVY